MSSDTPAPTAELALITTAPSSPCLQNWDLPAFEPFTQSQTPGPATDTNGVDTAGRVHAMAVTEAAPELPPASAPSAPPRSSARSLKAQSSKSFERAGKGKAAAVDAAASGIIQGSPVGPAAVLSRTEVEAYTHIGLAVANVADKAAEFRSRITDNETRMVLYVTGIERAASRYYVETNTRLSELASLIREVKTFAELHTSAAASVSVATDPAFLAVHKAVGENRAEIQKLLTTVRGLGELRTEGSVGKDVSMAFTPFSNPPGGPSIAGNHRLDNHIPPPRGAHQSAGNFSRPAKRARPNEGSREPIDVVYGPVNPRAYSSAFEMGKAAVFLVMRASEAQGDMPVLAVTDIRSVRILNGRSDMLSMRFRSHEKARTFIGLVQRFPPLDGQHASFLGNGEGARELEAGDDGTMAALDVLNGSSRSR